MKKQFTYLKKTLLALGVSLLAHGAMAATFTAVTSGNWTSDATWGGEAPGDDISVDDIIIPEGITVFLDTDVRIDGLFASIDVDGRLESTAEEQLVIATGELDGEGELELSYLEFETLGGMTFTGMAEIDEMVSSSTSLILSSTVNVADTLSLNEGNILLGAGSNLGMNTESVVKVNEGSITIGGGLFSSANPYVLVYVGDDKNTGIEANGEGLTDLYIQLDDEDAVVMLSGDVNVSGDLYQENGDIDLDGGNLILNGDYFASLESEIIGDENSDLVINATGDLSSNITMSESNKRLNDLMISGDGDATVTFDSDVNLMGDLMVEDGNLMFEGDNTFSISENATLMLDDAELMFEDGATFDGEAVYNVEYRGESNEAGLELSGSGLNDLMIDLDNEDEEVMIMSDVMIDGTLELNNGDFDMNGYNVTLMGDFQGNGNAEIQGNEESNLIIMTDGDLSDTLFFDADSDELNSLSLDLDGSGEVMLGSDLMVENIDFEEGMIVLIDGNLEVASTGTISGSDNNNFISTQGSGSLWMTVNVDAPYMLYPVGNEDGYSPAMIQIESGTAGSFGVNVMDGVLVDGTIGTDVSASESVVNRTWNVFEGTGSSTDINLMLSWSSEMEVNGFNNEDAYITHYTEGSWDIDVASSATFNEETEMFEMERQEISSLSPFAVKDSESSLSIDNTLSVEAISTYPNPASDVLFIDFSNAEGQINYALLNNQGEVVHTVQTVQGGSVVTVEMGDLPAGLYFIQVVEGDNVVTKKVIKS